MCPCSGTAIGILCWILTVPVYISFAVCSFFKNLSESLLLILPFTLTLNVIYLYILSCFLISLTDCLISKLTRKK